MKIRVFSGEVRGLLGLMCVLPFIYNHTNLNYCVEFRYKSQPYSLAANKEATGMINILY